MTVSFQTEAEFLRAYAAVFLKLYNFNAGTGSDHLRGALAAAGLPVLDPKPADQEVSVTISDRDDSFVTEGTTTFGKLNDAAKAEFEAQALADARYRAYEYLRLTFGERAIPFTEELGFPAPETHTEFHVSYYSQMTGYACRTSQLKGERTEAEIVAAFDQVASHLPHEQALVDAFGEENVVGLAPRIKVTNLHTVPVWMDVSKVEPKGRSRYIIKSKMVEYPRHEVRKHIKDYYEDGIRKSL